MNERVLDGLDLDWFLRYRHAEIPVFLLRMEPTETHPAPGTTEFDEVLREHFLYWMKLEAEGKLLAAGPVDDGTGLAVLQVSTRAEADAIAANEPFTLRGHRRTKVLGWSLNEGSAVAIARASASK